MRISVFGLGYVGAVSAGCLASEGHDVIGLDPNKTKVDLINRGMSPIIEKDIDGIIAKSVADGKLVATLDLYKAVLESEISFICVGTPSRGNGDLDLSFVYKVCEEIGEAIQKKNDFHVVVCRSTMLPGSMRKVVIPALEKYSGKKAGVDFGVCNNPEFLREGTAVFDYSNPPKTVIGESDSHAGDVLVKLYEDLDAPLIRTTLEVAEMVKYTDNNWHALKVAFANEIGNICKEVGIDSHKVMDIFCQDTKLNLSSYYLKPGFAFGGSCLPKDVRALVYKGKGLDLDIPILSAIIPSNQQQICKAISMITSKGNKKIGVLGFSFKAGTDDMRESPVVDVIENLLGKGYDIKIYDKNVFMASLTGANRDYILNLIPHISNLMVDSIDDVLDYAQTIVIGNRAEEFLGIMDDLKPEQVVVDLVRISDGCSNEQYDGICW